VSLICAGLVQRLATRNQHFWRVNPNWQGHELIICRTFGCLRDRPCTRRFYYNATVMSNSDPIKDLNALLTSAAFSRQNAEKVARVCHDAAKLVYERQKQTGKSQLKTKEISAALALAESVHLSAYRFVAEGPLVQLFGGNCDEARAWDYYTNHVLGPVTDKYGRTVVIDDDGIKSLYKDRESGMHNVASENYEEVRGKRLPWIRHTIENSAGVYVVEESLGRAGIRRTFLYTATVTIRLQQQQEQTSYYVVAVREGKNDVLRFVTAYSMFNRDGFLHAIAMSKRYVPKHE